MYKKILVAVDGSSASQRGLLEAVKLAKKQAADLRIIHVIREQAFDCGYASGTIGSEIIACERNAGQAILSDAQAIATHAGLVPQTSLVESLNGSACDSILTEAKSWPADLIVMGTHGRKGLLRLALGSDAESVVREAPVPVLLVRDLSSEAIATRQKQLTDEAAAAVVYG